MTRTAAVVLAAGGGTRFRGGTHKLLAPIGGRPVVAHAVDAALAAGFEATYVVTGAVEIPVPDGAVAVRNEDWAGGMATSLLAGIAAAAADGFGAVVVGLGDQPGIVPDAWQRVASATAPIAVALYGERRGHPVLLASEVWHRLPATGEAGARDVIASGEFAVMEVPCPGSVDDIDTVEDLAAWS